MYKGRRVFRLGPGWIVFFAGLIALFAVGAYVTYRERGWTWVSVGLALAAVFLGLGSIIETLVLRIELTEDALLVRDLRGRRRYGRNDIERVTQEKGVPPDPAARLPNSVRAWLKR